MRIKKLLRKDKKMGFILIFFFFKEKMKNGFILFFCSLFIFEENLQNVGDVKGIQRFDKELDLLADVANSFEGGSVGISFNFKGN